MNEVPIILSKLCMFHWIRKEHATAPCRTNTTTAGMIICREGKWPAAPQQLQRGVSVQADWMRAWQWLADLHTGCTEDSPKEFVRTAAAHSNPWVLI